jgi:hypothetical protein
LGRPNNHCFTSALRKRQVGLRHRRGLSQRDGRGQHLGHGRLFGRHFLRLATRGLPALTLAWLHLGAAYLH